MQVNSHESVEDGGSFKKFTRYTYRSTGYVVSGLLKNASGILVSEKNSIDKV